MNDEITAHINASKIHHYHKKGDVCFQAKDGTLLFDDSWRLSEASAFFSGLLSIPKPAGEQKPNRFPQDGYPDSTVEPIIIDAEPDVIAQFLDIANVAKPMIREGSYEDYKKMYIFCDKYGVKEEIIQTYRTGMFGRIVNERKQWDMLLHAAETNDITLARLALDKMSARLFLGDDSDTPFNATASENFWVNFHRLPHLWRASLFDHIFDRSIVNAVVSHQYTKRGNCYHSGEFVGFSLTDDWHMVSEKFNPGEERTASCETSA
ncbi:hypothetical protein CI109_106933 [Kwoniella shandongensis]|uniref:Uncharacterized protein n=1 Tax=Kwoniella shandongensis TaxID=1734106 RepID=A0A5M6C6I4_9TREE|nr:uncharacterized protein CI109_000813 [Kwoniella shandongensis]KAA5530633.1 hypothetical protein CI109_000813 [Kwoniella shandongensis]